jgi:urea transport system ATP-binding protein
MSEPLLVLDKVATAYGQSRVLSGIDMTVPAGSAVALIGRNGVGKTTLLRTIIGLQQLGEGRIVLAGRDIGALPAHARARAGIGFAPQGRRIFPHLTVEENLAVGLAMLGDRREAVQAAAPGFLFDLFPRLDRLRARKGGVLSGGEQQQLAIARALAGRPKLLLLDEPSEGIQPSVIDEIEEALRRIRDTLGVAILLVEQYLEFAWSVADSYYVMQRGRIVRRGSTHDETVAAVAHLVNI